MLTTDTTLQVRTGRTTLLYGHVDKLANTCLVEYLEWVYLQDLLLKICWQEASDIITAITECHLREVIGTEAEVLSLLCDIVSCQCGTRNLNHRTHLELNGHALFLEEFCGSITNHALLQVKLVDDTDEWHHNLWMWVVAFLLQLDGCAKDGTCLHGGNLGISIAQTATTVSQHGVMLTQGVDTPFNFLYGDAHLVGHDLLSLQVMGNKLVERWVEQADIDRITIHGLEDAIEVLLLVRQEFLESFLPTRCSV